MWSLDTYNSAAHEQLNVNIPSPIPATCNGVVGSGRAYWLPFIAADGTHYGVGPKGCLERAAGDRDRLRERTQCPQRHYLRGDVARWHGHGQVHHRDVGSQCVTRVFTNRGLLVGDHPDRRDQLQRQPHRGREPTVHVRERRRFPGGQPQYRGQWCPSPGGHGHVLVECFQLAAEGLSAPWVHHPTDACQQNSSTPLDFNGSELMVQATQQWNPYFCLNSKLFNVNQVQLPEPQPRLPSAR